VSRERGIPPRQLPPALPSEIYLDEITLIRIEENVRWHMANRRRNIQVKVYLSEEEYRVFSKQVEKSKQSQTDFFINCVKGKNIVVVEGLRDVMVDLKRIGANINQISKNLNGGFFQNADRELRDIRERFDDITNVMLEVLREVG